MLSLLKLLPKIKIFLGINSFPDPFRQLKIRLFVAFYTASKAYKKLFNSLRVVIHKITLLAMGMLGLVDCQQRQQAIYHRQQVKSLFFKWLNMPSQRKSYNWKGFKELIKSFEFDKPRIFHAS